MIRFKYSLFPMYLSVKAGNGQPGLGIDDAPKNHLNK